MSDHPLTISRRDLFRLAGAAGALTVAPSALDAGAQGAVQPLTQSASRAASREPLQALTAAEADILDAVVARLIPTDEQGPGATEASAVRYIDRALAGALAGSRDTYRSGLIALDRFARTSKGAAFVALTPTDQDAVLTALESGAANAVEAGFSGASGQFFGLVRQHTLQGTFGDPYYGGNANYAGWDLIGYPGVRTFVTPSDQRLGLAPAPNHRSAYDGDLFNKAQVSLHDSGGDHHGG